MSTTRTEMLAVNYLKIKLLHTGHIIPDIKENDKSPSWDGEISVYKDDSSKKENIIGIIKIQVKGVYLNDGKTVDSKFRIDKSDLINYKNNGGAILFVVYLNEKSQQFFCNDLTPEKIKQYLKQNSDKKSKKYTVPIYPLPDTDEELTVYIRLITADYKLHLHHIQY